MAAKRPNPKPTFDGKPMEGHHRYSANTYPHLADNPLNIAPRTPAEHLRREHGGNFRNQTHGKPLDPKSPFEF